MFIDYYEILGLESDASKKDIKSAYRHLAMRWHPDRNQSPNATDKMKLINEAYLILYDEEARARYDIQYIRFKSQTEFPSSDAENYRNEGFEIDDELLKEWISNARIQAEKLLRQTVEDLLGISRAAFSGFFNELKPYLITFIVIFLIAILA